MAKLTQIQLRHLTDGGDRILLTAQLEAGARLKLSAKVAMTVDKAKLSHIGGAPSRKVISIRSLSASRALANLRNGGLVNHTHEQPLIDK
jgi:hypothetical protein